MSGHQSGYTIKVMSTEQPVSVRATDLQIRATEVTEQPACQSYRARIDIRATEQPVCKSYSSSIRFRLEILDSTWFDSDTLGFRQVQTPPDNTTQFRLPPNPLIYKTNGLENQLFFNNPGCSVCKTNWLLHVFVGPVL